MPTDPILGLPYPDLSSAPNVPSDTQSLATAVGVVLGSAWTPYTPAQTGISLGNGILTGFYRQVGKTLDLNISFTYGSTTTYGAGDILIGLPPGKTGLRAQSLPVILADASTGLDYFGMGKLSGGGILIAIALNASFIASINSSRPFVWATGDNLTMSGRIEIA